MKPQTVIGIYGRWTHRRKGSAPIIDMDEGGSGRVVDCEMVQKETASGRGSHPGSSDGMEVKAMRLMVKRGEDDEKVSVVVTDEDWKMVKVIRQSRWNVRHEYDANDAKRSPGRHYQEFPKEKR
jgi:hypothetical protein